MNFGGGGLSCKVDVCMYVFIASINEDTCYTYLNKYIRRKTDQNKQEVKQRKGKK